MRLHQPRDVLLYARWWAPREVREGRKHGAREEEDHPQVSIPEFGLVVERGRVLVFVSDSA